MKVENKEDLLAVLWSGFITRMHGRILSMPESRPNVAVVEVNGKRYTITVEIFGKGGSSIAETNREHFFGDRLIADTIMLLTYDNHRRADCRIFKQELKDMAMRGNQLQEWLDSERDERFGW